MITTVVIVDAAVDVASSTLSRAAIVATTELLPSTACSCASALLLLLELSLKLLELL
jgi:hypothetical protein